LVISEQFRSKSSANEIHPGKMPQAAGVAFVMHHAETDPSLHAAGTRDNLLRARLPAVPHEEGSSFPEADEQSV
jgi:hypothetical protein